VLRIEVVAHNVKDLRSGKILDKLPELLKRMREMLVRFLGTVQAAHLAFLDEGAFERWSKPTQRGTWRLAGIDLNKARNRHVMDAVVALSTRPSGFTLTQVAEAVQQRAAPSTKAYTSRNAAYDLAKLSGKKLVHRVKGVTALQSRYFRRPGHVRLPRPARQGDQTAPCWCRASLCTSTQSPSPDRSALRQASRGAQPNL
jgi:hypothetical protein